jgi:hypothetical protein
MVIAHPGAMTSRAVCGDSTKRMVSRAEVRLALAVLTTERNAEYHSQCRAGNPQVLQAVLHCAAVRRRYRLPIPVLR